MRFIFPILFIIISIALFFYVVDPMYSDISKLRADVATYNLALSNSKDLQKQKDVLLEKYKNIKPEDKARLERFLPNTVNNIKFILEIERIANIHGMPLKNIKFENQAEAVMTPDTKSNVITATDPLSYRTYGVFPIEFMTEGTYETFTEFLKDIEHNLRLVDIKSVGFTVPQGKATDTNNPNIFSYTLKVETYWLK